MKIIRKCRLWAIAGICILTCLLSVLTIHAEGEEAPTLHIQQKTLSLVEAVTINYYVEYTGISSPTDIRLLVWTAPQASVDDYTIGTESMTISESVAKSGCQVFQYPVYARKMVDYLYVRAYAQVDGEEVYSDVAKYSVLQYCYNKLGYTGTVATNTALLPVLREILDYAASAQTYFDNYHVTEMGLANGHFAQLTLEGGTLADGFSTGLMGCGNTATLIAPETQGSLLFEKWVLVTDSGETDIPDGGNCVCTFTVPEEEGVYYYTLRAKYCSAGLTFTSDGNGGCTLSGMGSCTDTAVIVPAKSPAGDSVVAVGKGAFRQKNTVTSVSLPATVLTVGEEAFWGCTQLETPTLAAQAVIGEGAFKGCSSMADENGFVIYRNVLYDYTGSETSVSIPDSVTHVSAKAFMSNLSLTYVKLGKATVSIGYAAFSNCQKLASIGFYNCKTVGDYAFSNCKGALTKINLPASVTTLGDYAFYNCTRLVRITYSSKSKLESIGDYCFAGCQSLGVIYDSEITRYYVKFPAALTSIGSRAFYNCSNLREMNIGAGVKTIGDYAFARCSLIASVQIPEGVTTVGEYAFTYCTELSTLSIGSTVAEIGKYAFSACPKLKLVTLPAALELVSQGLFFQCTALTTVSLPETVTAIGARALYGCTALQELNFAGTTAAWEAVSLGEEWNAQAGEYTLNCKD